MKNIALRIENGEYKSFKSPFIWEEIPHLAILVGPNGSGKTQLLELFEKAARTSDQIKSWQQSSGNSSSEFPLLDRIETIRRRSQPSRSKEFFAWIDGAYIKSNEIFFLQSPSQAITKNHKVNSSGVNQSRSKCRSTINNLKNYHKGKGRVQSKPIEEQFTLRELELDKYLSTHHGENYYEKSVDDLLLNLPYHYLASEENKAPTLFTDLGVIFLQYKLMEAQYAAAAYRDGLDAASLNIEQAIGVAPWSYANALLVSSGVRYRINEPPEVSVNDTYEIRFQSIDDTSISIPAEDLSAGEQVIVGLVALFVRAEQFGIYPKLILMDEPDARLHSELIPKMLDSIQKLLTSHDSCRVIMTTHRPETIIASPPESLVEVHSSPKTLKIDKSIWWKGNADKAEYIEVSCRTNAVVDKTELIARLTGDAFMMRKNFRFVLTEDSDDQKFYRTVYSLLLKGNFIPAEPALVFQCVDKRGKFNGGGCEIVKSILSRINEDVSDDLALSPRLLCGLIDMDNCRESPKQRGLHKIGRYSIENYLFDPILVYSQLVDSEKISQYGLESVHSRGDCHLIRSASQQGLEKVSSMMISHVEKHVPKHYRNSNTVKISFVGRDDISINYPEWMITAKGKDIAKWYATAFSNDGKLGVIPLIQQLQHLRLIPLDLKCVLQKIALLETPSMEPENADTDQPGV